MSVWTTDQINRFSLDGEQNFAQEYKCLINRFALSIINGTSQYTLPTEAYSIRRVTYKGTKLDPWTHRQYRDFGMVSSNATPTNYIFNNLGQQVIKLYPTPIETITATQTNLFTPSVILTQCIVEYYVIPDGTSIQLPTYMLRRLLKAFILSQCFSIEGKGQNLKAAAYWESKWNYLKSSYGEELETILNRPRKLVSNPIINSYRRIPPTGVLPPNMQGTSVDADE